MDMPDAPLTALAAGAVQLHETFTAYMDAGFTEMQAMQILMTIIAQGMQISAAQQQQQGDSQ